MEPRITVAYVWHDDDVVEVRVSAWNGHFAGATELYVDKGEIASSALTLSGFPQMRGETREVSLGNFGSQFAGGAVSLRLYCTDAAGHAEAEVKIESATWSGAGPETVTLRGRFEPAALDLFVTEMVTLSTNLQGEAALRFSIK